MRIAVIGVPFNSSGLSSGEALAPAVLRDCGLLTALSLHHDVVDCGDIALYPARPERDARTRLIAPDIFAQMVIATRDAIRRAYDAERFPLVIGGECPLLLGCLAATREIHGPGGLLFIDGHEDAYSPEQSTTGETADMALGFATGITRPQGVAEVLALLPVVQADDVAIVGARDQQELSDEGVDTVAGRIETFPGDVVQQTPASLLMPRVMARVRREHRTWWLHLDLDVLSTQALPAVRYRQPGGLSWERLEEIVSGGFATPGLTGWNITIYNPDLDPHRSHARRIVQFISSASRQLQHQAS